MSDQKLKLVILDQSELNKNQKIVFNWLKEEAGSEGSLFRSLYQLYHLNLIREDIIQQDPIGKLKSVRSALRKLTRQEESVLLQALGTWVYEQEGK